LADGAERVPKFGRTSAEYFCAMTSFCQHIEHAPISPKYNVAIV